MMMRRGVEHGHSLKIAFCLWICRVSVKRRDVKRTGGNGLRQGNRRDF